MQLDTEPTGRKAIIRILVLILVTVVAGLVVEIAGPQLRQGPLKPPVTEVRMVGPEGLEGEDPYPQPQPNPPPDTGDPWSAPDLPEVLSRSLGCTWDNSLILSLLRPLETPEVQHDHRLEGLFHYAWRNKGVELVFDRQTRLLAVRLQTGRRGDGFRTFRGTWPWGSSADLGSLEVRRRLAESWDRQRIPQGDSDRYPGVDDEWSITYAADERGEPVVLNADLRIQGEDWSFVEGSDYPLPPPLPTDVAPVTMSAP